jgi:adenylate kinase family enzyme
MSPAEPGRAGPPGRLIVHVLGPPESGKSAISAALVDTFGGELFHVPTAAARRAAADPAFAARAQAGTDGLGWLQQLLVDEILGAEAAAGLLEPSRRGPLVVQGFPALVTQVRPWLRLAARFPGARSTALDVRVAERVLATRRAVTQLACPSCRPGTSPQPQPGESRCTTCDRLLAPRPLEHPEVYEARLRRYRRGSGPTRAAMSAAGVAWHRIGIGTVHDLHAVVPAACAAAAAFIPPAPPPGGRR